MGRRLGQHFLKDPGILDRIVDALDPQPDDVVIEIGPGKGSLTRRLAPRVGGVIAIEKDDKLARSLGERGMGKGEWAQPGNVEVVLADALVVDWVGLAAHYPIPHSPFPIPRFKVVGNIPYQITSPLIEKALTPPLPRVVVMLVQKEVADRLAAAAGSDDYGGLTVGVQSVAAVERLFVVKAGAFTPPPKVDSAVVRFVPLAEPLISDAERPDFRTFVTGLFGQRRKQMARSLRAVAGLAKDEAVRVLAESGIAESARVEVLTPRQLVTVFRASRGSHTL